MAKKTKDLANEYDVNPSTISTILSQNDKILEAYESNLIRPGRIKIKLSDYPDVDKAVLDWFDE
ncbi:tigger transposable element-derived 6-like [Brachionus plicatilis]|uniref:Tigger transposable element-derived 6-like n=1 Tax=Brachionus plicatilis TaxID=10195 RepID=A0A3M7RH76_BRAPC|nr:tigger transposable element-derived 6-like [Brachionus plicatilis]